MKGDAPRLSNNHGCATCWTQVPMLDSRLANQNVAKRRVRNSPMDSSNEIVTEGKAATLIVPLIAKRVVSQTSPVPSEGSVRVSKLPE